MKTCALLLLMKNKMIFYLFCIIACAASMPAAEELVELDLGLGADAVTSATPGVSRGLKPPHLRKLTGIKRRPFMVVPGLRNIALYKPVTCSDKEPVIGDIDQVNDGLKMSDDFDYVELGPGLQWVQIDLKEIYEIHAVVIWHYYKNAIIYNDVIVQVADDMSFKTNKRTLFNNDHDSSSGFHRGWDKAFYSRWWGEIVDARNDNKGNAARYVRVYTADGMEKELPRFVEIAVYGKEK